MSATQNSNEKTKLRTKCGATRLGTAELKSAILIMWKYSNLIAYGEFLETICEAKPVAAHKIQRENTAN